MALNIFEIYKYIMGFPKILRNAYLLWKKWHQQEVRVENQDGS